MAVPKKSDARKAKTPQKKSASDDDGSGNARYPRHSVEAALRIPRAILEQNAGNACSQKEAANFLGFKEDHGPFRLEVSSALKFGFLQRPSPGKIEPSALAKQIIRPHNPADELDGYRQSILLAPQISDVYKHYRGENLPDDQFLRNSVVDTYKVPAAKFEEFKGIFVSSLEKAQLLVKHGDKYRVVDFLSGEPSTQDRSDRIKQLGKGVPVSASDSCFVMQPFSPPLGGYYESIYKPAIEKAGLTAVRADADIFGTGKIIDQVWHGINAAKVLVAELTSRNPNVFYELGLAHALRKPVVLVSSNEEDVPFDLQHIRVIYYTVTDPFWGSKLIEKVAENILSAIRSPEEAIFKGPSA